jgi:mono/diheme cytochrome c family protein
MSLVRISSSSIAVAVVLFAGAGRATAEQKATGSAGQLIYDRDCATCHGPDGRGDGETAAYLTPQPQDFTTGILQKRSDEFLAAVIAKGGTAKGLAEAMPGFPKLSKTEVRSVVAYIRQLGRGGAKKAK